MAVEIKEIIIRAIVQEKSDNNVPASNTADLESTAEQLLKIIEKKNER